MYISGGENIYPAEVERILRDHPGIEDIAVVGVADRTWGEVGHAFVVPKQDYEISAEDVLGFCEGKLARYKWPKQVIFQTDFPRTALGKVRKTALMQDFMGNHK
jgi:fatty-acyl-CoA synthase